jgi:GNAT superfamily N-acetyltransferase
MPILTPSDIRIDRIQDPRGETINYTIITPKTAGYAEISLTRLDCFPQNKQKALETLLLDHYSVLGKILYYFPNGTGIKESAEEYMKRGVGTVVMNRIIEDCMHEGVAAIAVTTVFECMGKFLRKYGFSEDGDFYYLGLQSQPNL